MRKVLAAIARALRAMLGRFSAVMRRLLGLPDPGPDVEELDVADVGLDAVTASDVLETYSLTLARRIREAAAARLRGQDYEDSFSSSEHYERAWIGRLQPSQLERVRQMSDADILAHVSGERVQPGLLPMLRMPWTEEAHIPIPAVDPEPDPEADTGLRFAKKRPKTALSGIVRRIDETDYEMVECGVEAIFAAWREKMAREAAEEAADERDAA